MFGFVHPGVYQSNITEVGRLCDGFHKDWWLLQEYNPCG